MKELISITQIETWLAMRAAKLCRDYGHPELSDNNNCKLGIMFAEMHDVLNNSTRLQSLRDEILSASPPVPASAPASSPAGDGTASPRAGEAVLHTCPRCGTAHAGERWLCDQCQGKEAQ